MPTSAAPKILLVAGEASGDLHGAELIRELRQLHPGVSCLGTGGPRMRAAGQAQLFDLTRHAVVGLIEVLKHYPTFRRLFHQLIHLTEAERPDVVVLIDFPGFNLRLAARLRKLLPTIRIVYYISPQVWAWKRGRAQTMARVLDLLLVIFDFEKDWFRSHAPALRVEWVGHPMFDRLLAQPPSEPTEQTSGGAQRVALLPGSRVGEVAKHLPILVETARALARRRPRIRFVWIAPDSSILEQGQKILRQMGAADLPLETCIGYQFSHLHHCDLALVASGTVSLECAVMDVPQIVFYKVHPITYWVGRQVVKIRYLSMVNILAERAIVPELVQHDLQPEDLAARAGQLLDRPEMRLAMQEQVRAALLRLGPPGASQRAARFILEQLPTAQKVAA